MSRSVISEGKTTQEAVENGLRQLKVSKDMVDIKVLESEEKRSFFSILAPRIVKVELTVKEKVDKVKNEKAIRNERSVPTVNKAETLEREERKIDPNDETIKLVVQKINDFLTDFLSKLPIGEIKKTVEVKQSHIAVNIIGEKLNYLIGYRGETLNAIQILLTSIASNYSKGRIRILVDIENYRARRESSLEELAEKIAKTVIRTKKTVMLEPMSAYERKIIHSKLQQNNFVKTYSTGEEPFRKVVVAPK